MYRYAHETIDDDVGRLRLELLVVVVVVLSSAVVWYGGC